MKTYWLVRDKDISGVSGTGTVAEVVQFESGKCVVAWMTEKKSVAVYDSLDDVKAIHGHDGNTRLVTQPKDKLWHLEQMDETDGILLLCHGWDRKEPNERKLSFHEEPIMGGIKEWGTYQQLSRLIGYLNGEEPDAPNSITQRYEDYKTIPADPRTWQLAMVLTKEDKCD